MGTKQSCTSFFFISYNINVLNSMSISMSPLYLSSFETLRNLLLILTCIKFQEALWVCVCVWEGVGVCGPHNHFLLHLLKQIIKFISHFIYLSIYLFFYYIIIFVYFTSFLRTRIYLAIYLPAYYSAVYLYVLVSI